MVKRSWHDQNVKYYTYVNVLDEIKDDQILYYEDYEAEYETSEIENKYLSYCNNLITAPTYQSTKSTPHVTARVSSTIEIEQTFPIKLSLSDNSISKQSFNEEGLSNTLFETNDVSKNNQQNSVDILDLSPNESKSK